MEKMRMQLMNARQVQHRINRLAWQIVEQCANESELIMAGIASNGFLLAQRLKSAVEAIASIRIRIIELKIDKDAPLESPIQIALSKEDLLDKTILVVDDVSNSGRTLMYGVKPFLEHQVRQILTLVLVDRDHNRFPVKTNFVGLSLATTLPEHVRVELGENENTAVYLD
jgi:pyrimidine operon attenuation protein/uracil phosphoribosyltransferase